MIILENIELRRGSKALFTDASVTLQPGQKIALIGANGCGKSSFFAMLLGSLAADAGSIRGMESMRLAHMAQEVIAGNESACDYVLAGDSVASNLIIRAREAEAAEDFETAATLHQQLEETGSYSAPRRAEQLLAGLGFQPQQSVAPVASFSGGWRIRLNLARALMTPSDLLLLDEPTNHLDMDATVWLEDWLKRYPGTLVLISHDRDFIDATCERTLRIAGGQLHSYRGGYSDYERQRAEQLSQQQASFEKQQRRVAEIQDFVRRFRYKATKARQAQSRLKELERMETLAPAHIDSPFSFSFPEPGATSDPLLSLDRAAVGHGENPVLEKVAVTLRPGDRIGLLGRNGAGKSTLLKALIGRLPLIDGERITGKHLRIGYFDQQQLDVLDLEASPALHLQRLRPEAREQELLNFLGGFDFRGDMATSAIAPFSGGEKARLALAMVVWENPNVLILDEPTNHLDLEMRHALEVALNQFEGALVLVSHDRHLLRNSVEQLLLVHDGAVTVFEEDLNHYEKWLVSRQSSPTVGIGNNDTPPSTRNGSESEACAEKGSKSASTSSTSKKHQRQDAAARRAQLAPLRKALAKTERDMESAQTELAKLDEQLNDNGLYEANRKEELSALLQSQGQTRQRLEALEEQWLADQEALEAAE